MPTDLINPERIKGFSEKVQLSIISHDFWWNFLGKLIAMISAVFSGLSILQKFV